MILNSLFTSISEVAVSVVQIEEFATGVLVNYLNESLSIRLKYYHLLNKAKNTTILFTCK